MGKRWSSSEGCTYQGRRSANEDGYRVTELSDGRHLVAVADGMGGRAAGEVASRLALETFEAELEAGSELDEAVRAANRAVFERARENPEYEGMGTTLVALVGDGDTYRIANVGDSRAYRIEAGDVEQLTADHSVAAEAVRRGEMNPEEAEKSRFSEALTRAIGTEETVEVDVFGPFEATRPQVVLLCSDGLTKAAGPEDIGRYVRGLEELDEAVEALARLAYHRGGRDNITVAAAEFGRLVRTGESLTLPLPIVEEAEREAPAPRETVSSSKRVARLVSYAVVAVGVGLLSWSLLSGGDGGESSTSEGETPAIVPADSTTGDTMTGDVPRTGRDPAATDSAAPAADSASGGAADSAAQARVDEPPPAPHRIGP